MTPDQLLESLRKPKRSCPSCGSDNNCMVAAGKSGSACWCFSEEIPASISEDVAFGDSCYCRTCIKEV